MAGQLKRDIGLIGAAFIALNGIVGAGIFASPAALADAAGGLSPYLFLIFGVLMMSVAAVMAELAARYDSAGGPVVYVGETLGRFAGFQAGWLYYLARLAAFAANINALLTYLAVLAPGIDQGTARAVVIVAVVIAFALLNIVGVKQASSTLNVASVLKIAPLIVLVVWGLAAYWRSIPPPRAPEGALLGSASLLALYALTGFEIATLSSGETREAKRAVPLALLATIGAASVLYFLIQLAYVAIVGDATPESAPLAAAASILVGPWGAGAITLAAVISIGANLFAQFITTPRITFALAEDGALPRWFGAVHARFATPAHSIAALGIIAGALALSGAFVWLAVISALARLLMYLLCAAGLAKLKLREPVAKALVAWAAIALTAVLVIWAAAQAEAKAWLFLAGFAAIGTALYALSRWLSRKPRPI